MKETLQKLKKLNTGEMERGFVTYRTLCDVRFMDPAIEPNDRKPRWTFLGAPETANTGPVGIGRFSTLRAWLSQWSIDDSNADGPKCARSISVPLLAIENSADDAVPQPHARIIHDAAASTRQDLPRDQGRDPLLPGAARAAEAGGRSLCRMDG